MINNCLCTQNKHYLAVSDDQVSSLYSCVFIPMKATGSA